MAGLLTQWTSIVENYTIFELQGIDHFYQVIYPYISNYVDLQDLDKSIPTEVPWDHDRTEAYLLVGDQKFKNMIYWHWVLQWNVELNAPSVSKAIDRIIQLSQELSE